MALMKLFNRTETILRSTGEGYIDDDENWVAGDLQSMSIECNIQPYREGTYTNNTPTGFTTKDAIKVYSDTLLIAADDTTGIVGDQMTYRGQAMFCKSLEVWEEQTYSSESLIPNHYLGYFYRKDKT